MAVQLDDGSAATCAPSRAWPPGRVIAWVLVAAWALLALTALFVCERPSTLPELEARLAAGDVDTVWVEGGLPRHAHGFSHVELTWRRGLFVYSTTVIEARGRVRVDESSAAEASAVVREPVRDLLTRTSEDLDVRSGHPVGGGSSSTVMGWRVPGWLGLALACVWMATVVRLAFQQPLRRGTRWAWFWLVFLAAPLGPVAFLLLGGPASRPGDEEPGTQRLNGGTGFLLALAGGLALGSFG